jgi:hypothetical protein
MLCVIYANCHLCRVSYIRNYAGCLYVECLYTECLYAECLYECVIMLNVIMLNIVMLNVFMLCVFMLSVFMLSVFMLSVFMLSVFMLNVVILNVIAPGIRMGNNLILKCLGVDHEGQRRGLAAGEHRRGAVVDVIKLFPQSLTLEAK